MKVAYLASRYPAVSHTFILREIFALRGLGIDIDTFSVRRAAPSDILGDDATREFATTRWLVPPHPARYLAAFFRAVATRPRRTLQVFRLALACNAGSFGQRLKWMFYFVEAVQLARWLEAGRHDRLHCHFGNNGASTAMLAARLANIPFSMTCHGSELNEPERYSLAEKVQASAFTVCVSEFGRSILEGICPEDQRSKLHVVRCGLEPDTVNRVERTKNDLHQILSVGRLSPEKAQGTLLDALARLRDADVKFHCTLVGEGPMRAQLEARAAELKLDAHLTLTGALAPDRVVEHYGKADVVVLSSISEGVPIVLMEAMSHALPVVATEVGGVPELVDNGRTGLLVPPEDPAALAEALRRILDDPDRATEMGREGAKTIVESFNATTSAAQLEKLFRAIRTSDS